MAKSDDKRRALARCGLGRTELVFDDTDVVDLLRIAVEREGGQSAFARHSGANRTYLNRVLSGKEPARCHCCENITSRQKLPFYT